MQRKSLKPLIPFASCILLPYGVVTADNAFFMTYQYWLFPLWTYIHGFGAWLGYGIIIPPFSPGWGLQLLSFLGLIWFAFGLCTSIAFYRFYSRQIDEILVWPPALGMLALQTGFTVIVSYVTWSGYYSGGILWAIPLPLHPLIVLFLFWTETRRLND